ncbi:biotin--[acetyl-CoA-carboxylase] ligase [Chitinilyticum litopenaei]|uniref:biotin--[acetyl-CoA-carboxylase] ligase n=1 Tax=Chitinilyticum litopenaei TaxID=1121276 RepID=UPI000406E06F|nr:biotin--[acetyl-CoA-carboxylase] ligase [Chitinilyticum litopenaei]
MADTLTLLRALQHDRYHSGSALAEQFQCSRASISGALAEAESYGIELERKHGVGYRLIHPIVWLDEAAIAARLPAQSVLQLQLCSSTASTNRSLLQNGSHGQVLATEWQSAGRGRRGRSWQAPAGGALLFSLAWQFDGGASRLAGLPLAVGACVAETLSRHGVTDIALKWPNDLLLPAQPGGWAKAGGILIEMQGDALGPSLLVIGVGLNLAAPVGTDNAASGLSAHGLDCDRNTLLGDVLAALETLLRTFAAEGFSPALRQHWEARHAWQNEPVTAILPDGSRLPGLARGLAADGSLLLDTAQGMQTLASGDISLRRE